MNKLVFPIDQHTRFEITDDPVSRDTIRLKYKYVTDNERYGLGTSINDTATVRELLVLLGKFLPMAAAATEQYKTRSTKKEEND